MAELPPGLVLGRPPRGAASQTREDKNPPPPGAILGRGLPGQSIEGAPAPQGGPVMPGRGSLDFPVDDMDKTASFMATIKSGLSPELAKQVKILSDQRGVPLNKYATNKDGNIVYFDDETQKWTREIPSLSEAKGVVDFMQRFGQIVGTFGGPTAGEGAGGATAMWAPGPMKLAAPFVTAGVDLLRQGAGNLLADEDPLDLSYMTAAGHAGLTLAGQGLSAAFVRGAEGARPFGMSRYNAEQLSQPGALPAARNAMSDAELLGIRLTPGQATTSGRAPEESSLLVRERQNLRTEEGGNVQRPFVSDVENRGVPGALDITQGRMRTTPTGMGGQAERRMTTAADAVVDHYTAIRDRAASPHYRAAFDSGATVDTRAIGQVVRDIENEIDRVPGQSSQRRTLDQVLDMIAPERPTPGGQMVRQPETNLEVLHNAKIELDGMMTDIAEGKLSVQKTSLRRLEAIQNSLTNRLRQASTDYETGYQAFIRASPAVDDAIDLTATLRQAKQGDLGADTTIASVFSRGDPTSIGRLRNQFIDAGQEEAWNQGMGSYIASQAEKYFAMKAPSSGFAKWLHNPKIQANLRASMTPQQWNAWETLTSTMQRVASRLPEGSATSTDQVAKGFGAKIPNFLAKLLQTVSLDAPARIGRAIEGWNNARGAGEIARIITSPNALDQLERIRLMSLPARQRTQAVMLVVAGEMPWLWKKNPANREPGSFAEPTQ